MTAPYLATEPSRADVDRTQGPVVLEFGAPWCGICAAAQPAITKALREYPQVQHIKVADGRGQALGRSFGIKLWPTLIAMRDGRELGRLVRPTNPDAIASLLATIA
ncbi:MAG TPA: thioredoxin family protein [Polyangiales bacterium]|nr:thioredoxin family protein [Polyangiales bacterium]